MALSPQKSREIVLQLLYSEDLANPGVEVMIDLMMKELAVSKKNVYLAQEKMQLIQQHLPAIDRLISSVSTSYDFDRIQLVTKSILRLSVFEMFYDQSIPPKVAIAEAIRLSRKFNSPESASFVNALLDHLYQLSKGVAVDDIVLQEKVQGILLSEKNEQVASQEFSIKEDPEIENDLEDVSQI
jgi:N utilization substance protein B